MSLEFTIPLISSVAASALYDLLKKSKDKNTLNELKNLIGQLETKTVFSHKKSIKQLKDSYHTESLVFVLGAGVSMDYGLPSWNTLLQRLIAITFEDQKQNDSDKNATIGKLFNMVFGPNALIAARYLALYFKELEKKSAKELLFEESIRKVLYEGLDPNQKSKIYQEIIKLCVSPGRNKSLDSVITYNFDDLLEKHLEDLCLDIPYKSICTVGQNPSPNELPIYHVHGYIPRTGELSMVNRVTLGDDTYHSQYTDIYRWSNLIQLNKFKEKSCLFIGSSFTDPNMRRLLDIAKDQRGTDDIQHFILKKKYSFSDVEKTISKLLENNEQILDEKVKANLGLSETAKALVDAVQVFETNDAHSFGAEIIWIDDFKDISKILKEIRT